MIDERMILGDFIYQLHKREPFYGQKSFWSEPLCVFSASTQESIAEKVPKFIKSLREKKILREDINDLICVLGDWNEIAEGIFFTSKAIYVNSPKNEDKKFRVRYDDITDMTYYSNLKDLLIRDYEGKRYTINTPLWNVHSIKIFLDFASKTNKFDMEEKSIVESLTLPHCEGIAIQDLITGTVYGNISNATTLYGEEKFHAAEGHGYAAERANTLFDKYLGHDTIILGDDNQKNGADRIVDGIKIQSKYCETGGRCISECFEDGKFRYFNSDGSPMQIEVPSDKYDAAITAMEERIRRGQIPGVENPEEAKNIVRKGHFTYNQAKNIAKAGTVESVTYDAANGMIIATSTFGMTAILTFATSIWNGESVEVALESAAFNGLKVGGATFVTAVLAGQLSKAGLNSLLVGSSEAVVKAIGPKASAVLVNALRSGKDIYGAAAMKSAAKLFRGNVITGTISVVVFSTGDVINIFRKRISGPQLFKNVTNTAASVTGGTAGFIAGFAVGGPVGGLLGAMIGGSTASEASNAILSNFIEDDANEMVRIIENEFIVLAEEYLLTQREVEHVVDHLDEVLNAGALKDMYASVDRDKYAREMLIPLIDCEINRRLRIGAISHESIQKGLQMILESISDNEGILVFE